MKVGEGVTKNVWYIEIALQVTIRELSNIIICFQIFNMLWPFSETQGNISSPIFAKAWFFNKRGPFIVKIKEKALSFKVNIVD